MGITLIPQDFNKSALTMDLGSNVLGDKIISAEIPWDRADVIKLSPMAQHLFGVINHADQLGEAALQSVTFTNVGNSTRLTLRLDIDMTRDRNFQWTPGTTKIAQTLVSESFRNPLVINGLVARADITFRPYAPSPKNNLDMAVCREVTEALSDKTKSHGGQITILNVIYEQASKKVGLFSRVDTPYLAATVITNPTGSCDGCSAADLFTLKKAAHDANKKLPDGVQVSAIRVDTNSANRLVMLRPK